MQIVVQGFAVHRQSTLPRVGNRGHAFLGRSMHEIDPDAGMPGQADDVAKRQVLGQIAVREMDVVGLVAALAFELFEHVAHDLVFFGVHGHDAAVFGDLAEYLPQMAGRNAHLHRGEHLEAPDPLL